MRKVMKVSIIKKIEKEKLLEDIKREWRKMRDDFGYFREKSVVLAGNMKKA